MKKPPPGSTTGRGYGQQHQKARRAALLAWYPGQPCARCGQPMRAKTGLELDHTDDRTGYRGLAHAECNRSAGGRKAHGDVNGYGLGTPSEDW